MPLIRGAAELLERLESAREQIREYRKEIRGEAQKLITLGGKNAGAIQTLAHNILGALADIDRVDNAIDKLIRDELRPKLEARRWREARKEADLVARVEALEKEIEELRRPKNVLDLNNAKRKEGNG